jgi:hypothetical protein
MLPRPQPRQGRPVRTQAKAIVPRFGAPADEVRAPAPSLRLGVPELPRATPTPRFGVPQLPRTPTPVPQYGRPAEMRAPVPPYSGQALPTPELYGRPMPSSAGTARQFIVPAMYRPISRLLPTYGRAMADIR